MLVFIVIIGVGVAGLVTAMNTLVRFSADPMRTKQMLAIAEALLNEVMHQPFTWCDPDDPAASTAQSYAGCALPQNTGTFTPGESRLAGTFDNVDDYGAYTMANVTDASGNNAMTGYTASVAIVRTGTALGLADNTAALSVTVTVSFGADSFSLTGYRFRYAPRY
ncbi:type II secretion system protein [Dechloromonas sp. XY25]|uniref:Type II secretion system protein n=1 Tax=Dechloromonas hankyongensis TaxID=2908002 RepID=A0ABS9K0T3_9RHOO|nr:type II secretion system protein [Dechloromonas hankyongensis]